MKFGTPISNYVILYGLNKPAALLLRAQYVVLCVMYEVTFGLFEVGDFEISLSIADALLFPEDRRCSFAHHISKFSQEPIAVLLLFVFLCGHSSKSCNSCLNSVLKSVIHVLSIAEFFYWTF